MILIVDKGKNVPENSCPSNLMLILMSFWMSNLMDLLVRKQSTMRHLSAKDIILELPWPDHVPNLDEFGDGNEDEPKSSKQRRCGTVGSEQNKKRKRSGKFVVKYNSLGVRAGEEAIKLSMYIGVLGRTSILILYND